MPSANIRIPLVAGLNINSYSGSDITSAYSFMRNGLIDQYSNDPEQESYATQRPSLDVINSPDFNPNVGIASRGRAAYFWERTDSRYFINDDKLFRNTYANEIGTLAAGSQRCYITEISDLLFIVDPENNQMWTVDTLNNVVEITDPDRPMDIAHGVAVLNGTLYILNVQDSTIQNTAIDDPTDWNALDFIGAAREEDIGVFLTEHHDHIMAAGTRSIEFFYDAGNPEASPLNRRDDIYYNIGVAVPESVWRVGDTILFVGKDSRGAVGVYRVENFRIQKVSDSNLDSYLTNIVTMGTARLIGSGLAAQGHEFYVMSILDEGRTVTLAYDLISALWNPWTTGMALGTGVIPGGIPIIDWTVDTTLLPRLGEGIAVNGAILSVTDTLVPIDGAGTQFYVEEGYVDEGYFEEQGVDPVNIDFTIRLGGQEVANNDNKFCRSLELIHPYETADLPQTAIVRWSDDDAANFEEDCVIQLNERDKLSALGMFNRRTWEVQYEGTQQVRLEAIELKLWKGRH